MNDLLAPWSAPWHALQRSLASDRGGCPAAVERVSPQPDAHAAVPGAGGTWLRRTKRAAPETAAKGGG